MKESGLLLIVSICHRQPVLLFWNERFVISEDWFSKLVLYQFYLYVTQTKDKVVAEILKFFLLYSNLSHVHSSSFFFLKPEKK